MKLWMTRADPYGLSFAERDALILALLDRIAAFDERLNRPVKTPGTSSQPPSRGGKATRPLWKKKPRRRGEGPGVSWTLAETPDQVIDCSARDCPHCGTHPDAETQIPCQCYDHITLPVIRPVVSRVRLLGWLGRRRSSLSDSTLKQYQGQADRRLDAILKQPTLTKAGAVLRRQTICWRARFFTFLTHRAVPATNNDAERALRPSVIFRKVTNGFRSKWGADTHALIRSVIGTGRLNGLSPHQALNQAVAGINIINTKPAT